MIKTILLSVISYCFLISVAAADQHQAEHQMAETHSYSGFLGNYDDFEVLNTQSQAEVWIKPPHEDIAFLNKYDAIVFSPIEVWLAPDSEYQGIDPNEMKLVTDTLLQKLQESLGQNYKIVEKAGPNVMNMRIAITGVSKEKPDYIQVINLLPVKLAWELGNAAYREVTSQTVDVFSAQMEMEILDSESGERLVAAIDKHEVADTRSESTSDSDWSPMDDILSYWAETIDARLMAAKKNN
ncbi:MAG: DUF3313 domain-containing protein [Pseudomonadota bacterium]